MGSNENEKTIGIISGVWDLFHVGHAKAIMSAKEQSDILYIGVNSDDFIEEYKGKSTVVDEEWRLKLINQLFGKGFIKDSFYTKEHFEKYDINTIFIGENWKGSEVYKEYQRKYPHIKIVYLPTTPGISSTKIRKWVSETLK